MIVATERAGVCAALAMRRFGLAASRVLVSFKRSRRSSRVVVHAAGSPNGPRPEALTTGSASADASAAVIGVAVIECRAPGVIVDVVVNDVVAMPVATPVMPTPAEPGEESDPKSDAERQE